MSPASRERNKENPRRGGRELRRDGKETDKSWTKDITEAEERERRRKKKEEERRERDERRADKRGNAGAERSKGYLHRVVFFQCFLFEQFVEGLSRLIFGMMSMNYILYKIRERFKRRSTNALSRASIV